MLTAARKKAAAACPMNPEESMTVQPKPSDLTSDIIGLTTVPDLSRRGFIVMGSLFGVRECHRRSSAGLRREGGRASGAYDGVDRIGRGESVTISHVNRDRVACTSAHDIDDDCSGRRV